MSQRLSIRRWTSMASLAAMIAVAIAFAPWVFAPGSPMDERAQTLTQGRGRLFVGPDDLRRTDYADSYIYYLLPNLRPATYYVTLDPGVTERSPHRLATELKRADVLILNKAYDREAEKNRSARYGSSRPNVVVAHELLSARDLRDFSRL